MLDGEIWKQLKDFPNYEVSTLGLLRRIRDLYVINGGISKCGYLKDKFHLKNQKYIHKLRHQIVAEAFLENINNYPQINHIDGNKLNNNIDNLEWCSRSENIKHAFRLGLKNFKGSKNPSSKLTQEIVDKIRELSKTNLTHQKIADIFNISQRHVTNLINRKRWDDNEIH